MELRGTANDLLHRLVREGLPRLRTALSEADRTLPWFVQRELERFVLCGDPRNGFAWLECDDCDERLLVPFSCKGRAFCPACIGRRMAERSAHLVDRVLPHVGTRQWVLTVPWKRRWLLSRRPELARGVLKVALDRIERFYQGAVHAPTGRSGAVTVTQRFGSTLRLNLHFHIIHLDGVYVRARDGRLSFRQATPHQADVEALVVRIATAAERWLSRQGHGEDDVADEDGDDALGVLQQASLAGREALGARSGRTVTRVRTFGGREEALPPRCAGCDGYNLHAGVAFKASDREGLERLLRYALRPPLAKGRLSQGADGTVVLGLKKAWSDGTTAVKFDPVDFVSKLAALVPPPRKNTTLYRGVLAANAAWRAEVVPKPPAPTREEKLARKGRKLARKPRWQGLGWADLLERVFGVDAFRCSRCGGRLSLRCVVINPPATTRILRGLFGSRAPP